MNLKMKKDLNFFILIKLMLSLMAEFPQGIKGKNPYSAHNSFISIILYALDL